MLNYIIILSLLIGITYLIYLMKKLNYWKNLGVKFVKPLPLFGNILDILLMKRSIGEVCKSIYDKTSEPFIGFFFFHEPRLMITDLDMIKCILIKDFDVFMDRSVGDNKQYDTVGSNLNFLMKSPKWNAMRRKLTPAFSPKRMKVMSELMKTCSQNMVDYIENKCSQNKVLDVKTIFTKFIVDSVILIFYGLEGNCFKDDNSPFNAISNMLFNWKYTWNTFQICAFFIAPNLVKLFKFKFVDTATGDFFRDLFWKTIREREKTKLARDDAIDLLIKSRNPNLNDDIEYLDGDILVAQALNFFSGGVETTSSTLTFALIEIAKNNEIQNKLRKEIFEVRGEQESLWPDNIQKMPYLEKVILEILRKYPVLPFLDRRCSKEYTLPGSSLTLKKGSIIYISVLGIHYNEKYYPDPHRFDPERFSQDNIDQRHSMTFIPFGDGPRACLGRRFAHLSMAYSLAYILSNFEVRMLDQTTEDISWKHKGVTLQPQGDTHLEFIKL